MSPSTPHGPNDLQGVFNERYKAYGSVIAEQTEMLSIVEQGVLPAKYNEYFPVDTPKHIINNIGQAARDLTDRTAKEFPLYAPPKSNTATARENAEKVERVNYSYLEAGQVCGGVGYRTLMHLLSSDLVTLSDAVAQVCPNYDYQTPYFMRRDPRHHLPPVGWQPWKGGELNGTLFAYQETLGVLMSRYPDRKDALRKAYSKTTVGNMRYQGDIEAMPIWVGEYYHSDAWYFATLDAPSDSGNVTITASESGDPMHPGVCGIVALTQPALTRLKGRSIFADQVSLMAALARMISQKIAFYDKTLHPLLFLSETVDGEVNEGPGGITIMKSLNGERPFVEQVAPANPVDADQTIDLIYGLCRMLNYNPEQFAGAGPADSAKALSELNSHISTTIMDGFWPAFMEGLPKLLSQAMWMDKKLWGNERKKMYGKKSGSHFMVDYTPNLALKGYENSIRIEPGIGLAGYAGTIELLQRYQSGTISLRQLLEQLPDVRDVEATMGEIRGDKLEEVMFAIFATKAEQGLIDVAGLAKLRKMNQEGEDFFDAIEKLNAAGQLEKAPEAPPGIPPALAGMMPGMEAGPPPPPSALRVA